MAREHSLKKLSSAFADVHTIQLSGSNGTSAVYVNGEYSATDDEAGGRPLYRKVEDSDILIEYWAPLDEWQVMLARLSDVVSNLLRDVVSNLLRDVVSNLLSDVVSNLNDAAG
jgi:hypothetical protein